MLDCVAKTNRSGAFAGMISTILELAACSRIFPDFSSITNKFVEFTIEYAINYYETQNKSIFTFGFWNLTVGRKSNVERSIWKMVELFPWCARMNRSSLITHSYAMLCG